MRLYEPQQKQGRPSYNILRVQYPLTSSERVCKYVIILCAPSVIDDLCFQVQPETVATDSYMVNLQAVLLRFCEPFIDANYTKVSLHTCSLQHHTNDVLSLTGSIPFTTPAPIGSS